MAPTDGEPRVESEDEIDREELLSRIGAAVRRRHGLRAKVENCAFPTLGGSNNTVVFDLVTGSTPRRVVFRQETIVQDPSPFIDPHRQYEVMRVAFEHGLDVPQPLFELDDQDRLDRAYVTAFVSGETLPRRLLSAPEFAPARAKLPAQAGSFLARLHSIDTKAVAIVGDVPASRDPLGHLVDIYDSYQEPHPALEVGFRWLETHRPDPVQARLVHGDFRNGNLMVDETGLRAVLDWECTHLGDPMEDLAWLCLRSWRFGQDDLDVGGFGPRRDLYDAYVDGGGVDVDPDRVFWWEIFGFARWAVLNMMQSFGHLRGERRSLAFAACGRNTCLIEYEMLMTLVGEYSNDDA